MTKITVEVTDDARPDHPPIEMRVIEEGYGVAVSLTNAQGYEIGRVALDYHDNELKALVYRLDDDDPAVTLLSPNVDADLTADPKEPAKGS
jgi:hypothetical protein